MKMLVIDGNSIVNRAFYGVRPLTTRDGRQTHAIYGFLTMVGRITADTAPDAVAVAFDMRAPTFRHLRYAAYKGKRKGMPEELASQMQPLKDILKAMGYKIVTCEGWEADDILGTLARKCSERGDECVIATGDRDTLQLIGSGVSVRLLSTKEGKPVATLCDEAYVKENYGVTPPQLKDIKAIQGDTSDNIPGVPGIGEKGARELIERFGSLDGVYEHIDDDSIKAGMRKKLTEGKESAYLSYWLGTVSCEAPVDTDINAYVPAQTDARALRALMTDLELFSLLKKMQLPEDDGVPEPRQSAAESKPVDIVYGSARDCIDAARQEKKCDFVWYANDGQIERSAVCTAEKVVLLPADQTELLLREICADESIAKRTHDIKELVHLLCSCGCESTAGFVMDTMLAAYLVNPSANDYSLTRLEEQYLGAAENSLPAFLADAAQAVRFTALCDTLANAVEQAGMTPLLRDIELPLAVVLAEMELAGFAVDSDGIRRFGELVEVRAAELEKSIYAEVGYEFNINSPKQLGEALFVKLGLPGGKKTKTGYSTSADVLDNLRGVSPAVDMILEYRMLTKLNSTYCKGLLKCVDEDGRIRTSFNQTETRTGRISSAEPNLQNIPVRTELGRELRRYFTAREGCVLIDADYSQIELRVLAHMANDANMIEAFRSGTDIHRVTAAQVFGVPPELVTSKMRSNAKAVNFGIVYGISAFSLAKDIGVSNREAQEYIASYMATYSAVADFMKGSIEQAKRDGYARTLYGRRRYLPELSASNFNMRSFGERVARNMPIQGTAADIIKLAMVRVRARLREQGLSARLIMQVHDELIIEAPISEENEAKRILEEEMRGAAQLSVELCVDAHSGKSWLDAKN